MVAPDPLTAPSEALVRCGGQLAVQGLDENWVAPVAWIDSPIGFGEEDWIPSIPGTSFLWAETGAPIQCEFGRNKGKASRPGRNEIILGATGTPNHFICRGQVKFWQIYFPAPILCDLGQRLGLQGDVNAHLRDDLQFFEDDTLWVDLDRYAKRAFAFLDSPTRMEMETRALLIVEQLLSRHHQFDRTRPAPLRCDRRIRRSFDLIEAHIGEDIGLAGLAANANLSASHYIRLFKAATGMAPHAWIMHRRIARACELLREPGHTITDIAFLLGFASSQHFATIFRQNKGITPSAYRRKSLQ